MNERFGSPLFSSDPSVAEVDVVDVVDVFVITNRSRIFVESKHWPTVPRSFA
jgi:hypothetical protein